ncbi:MAG TPA: hypothetical protein VMF12_20925 [Xanthobacteraceae bacterium]|nr:hypothetical protein [Xanthobacteraceae bacterium]
MKIGTTLSVAVFCLALAPAAVRADAQQDQAACMNDAMTVCGQFIPDRERVAACLMSNRTRISVACRDALKRFNARTASTH